MLLFGITVTNVPSKLCAHCARTQVVRRAQTSKLGAHINVPSKNVFCAYFSYMSFQFWLNSGKMLHKRNLMCTQTQNT